MMKEEHAMDKLRYWPKLVKTRKGVPGETLVRIPVPPGQYMQMQYAEDGSTVIYRLVYADGKPRIDSDPEWDGI